MCCITRGIVRWGLISALALGGATAVLGKERVKSALHHVGDSARTIVDDKIADSEDPMVLRRQLARLSEQYPDRIAEVKGELAEVERQLTALTEDSRVSETVVAMATEDLGQLKDLVRLAEAEIATRGSARAVAVRFEGTTFDLDSAYEEATRIRKVRTAYDDRLAQNRFQIELLGEQRVALLEILERFEKEYDTYTTQLLQLEQQIAAMARNERLIELTREQQATLQSFEQMGRVGNLGQIEAKLAEMRTRQEATLEQLRRGSVHENYEDRARARVNGTEGPERDDPFAGLDEESDDDDDEADAVPTSRALAFGDRIVIGR
jgi:hypothetical protein